MPRPKMFRRVALALLLVLAVAACGGDDDNESSSTTEGGGGGDATTAPAGTAPEGAQSGPDTPEPQPLDEMTTIKAGVAVQVEAVADLYLADALGEFEKENLEVEISVIPIPDATALLIGGELDLAQGGILPPHLNAIATGNDLAMMLSGPEFPEDDDFGVWADPDLWEGDEPDPCAFEGATVSVGGTSGWGSAMAGPFLEFIKECDLEPSDINLVTIAPNDALLALENGSVDAAYLTDPFWGQARDGGAKLAVPFGQATSVGWISGGLRESDPEVADAIVRALLRTRRTYMQPGYKEDPEVREALLGALGLPEEALDATPELNWDVDYWDPALLAPVQSAYNEIGGIVAYEDPLSEDQVFDRSILERVLAE